MNVCLIGLGSWGKRLLNSIKGIRKIKTITVIKNRKDQTKINYKSIKWAFISVSTLNHYNVVKKILKNKVNVFCEKPLTNNLKQDIELFKIAKKNKCKLYVSDIENFKNKKLTIKKENFIIRQKFSKDKSDIANRLAYHDFTYLFKYLRNKKEKKLKVIKKKLGEIKFSLEFDNKKFSFDYSLNSKSKKHTFNNIDLTTKKNVLRKMILKIINNKINFTKNANISIFSNKLTKKINASK
jgi:hypothetical protein